MATPEQPVSKSRSSLIITILSIIVVLQAVKIFMDYREKNAVRTELEETTGDLSEARKRMEEIKLELDKKIAEISELGGNIEELTKAKAEVEATLKKNKAWSAKNIRELKDKVQGYEKLLKLKDEELEELRELNDALYTENNDLKVKQNKLNDSINRISRRRDELAGKVAIASQLRAENIRVFSVSGAGRERESPFRGRQIEKIKVTFSLAENKVAPIEGKKIFVRLLDENGQVIFDVARGSGTFKVDGREEWYTAIQEILFDNTRQTLTFFYEKGTEYASGNYTVEAWADNYRIGTAAFIVK